MLLAILLVVNNNENENPRLRVHKWGHFSTCEETENSDSRSKTKVFGMLVMKYRSWFSKDEKICPFSDIFC